MRDYSKVSPLIWTGPTGKALRAAGRDAQVVAFYVVTCPSANMIGFYYLPLPVLCHETGISSEEATKALRRVSEAEFAQYDDETETVWVLEMARFQVGDSLKPGDLRIKGIVKELATVRKCKFSRNFYDKYRVPFNLPELSWWGEEVEPLQTPSEAPSGPLRSQEQEQQQEQEKEQSPGAAAPSAPSVNGHGRANERAGLEGFDRFWIAYPNKRAKQDAIKAWRKLRPGELLRAQMIAALEAQRRQPDWTKDGGRFVPYPATWLGGRRWEDQLPTTNGFQHDRTKITEAWEGRAAGKVAL